MFWLVHVFADCFLLLRLCAYPFYLVIWGGVTTLLLFIVDYFIRDHLHWRHLLTKLSATATRDSHMTVATVMSAKTYL